MTETSCLETRVMRIEAQLALQQLACRYALAIDVRDIDCLVELFIDDVDCGPNWGKGRGALAAFYRKILASGFYRSHHQINGHVIDLIDPDTATGTVYCRAEHEDGDHWYIMTIVYKDQYARRNGEWFFERRRDHVLYSSELLDRPQRDGSFNQWPRNARHAPTFPQSWPSWAPFWSGVDDQQIAGLTRSQA